MSVPLIEPHRERKTMKVFLAFLLGAILAISVVWFLSDSDAREKAAEAGDDIGDKMNEAGREIRDAVGDVDTDEVRKDVKDAGRQVMDKTREVVSDVTITASIKSKFAASPEVSALSIDVDTTDGRVTLSGKVNSAEEVNRAVEIASTVEGVRQVISTLLIDSGTSASDPGS
jgi:hypothetical protein